MKQEKRLLVQRNPRGSWGWLIFWIIICYPIAIIYAIMRDWHKEEER